MQYAHRRHDISDRVWELLKSHLPGREGTRGVTAHDNRRFLNAVFWILRAGAPWRDLPPDGYGAHKRGLNSKIHLAVDAHGMPVRMFITAGTVADCSQACKLVEGIDAENLLADKGYDSDEFVKELEKEGITPVIPPRKNRKNQRYYDRYLYRLWHLVENAFLELKRWRGIATRYAKNTASFLAAVHIRCIAIWAKIY